MDLRFDGEPGCGPEAFARGLETHLAGSTATRRVRVTLRLARDDHERWTADLSLETADSRSARRLTGATCFEVCDAAAFVTAVIVDPGVLARAPTTTPPPEPPPPVIDPWSAPEPAAEPDPWLTLKPLQPRLPAPVAAPTPRPRPGGLVRLGGGLEALGLPAVGPQATLAAGLRGRAWRSELVLAYRAPTRVVAADDPAAGASIRMWSLGARGCGVLPVRPLELGLCGGFEAGQAVGAGEGYLGARRDRIAWFAVTLGPTLSWTPRPWLALAIGPELAIPALRGSFTVAGLGTLFKVAPVSLRLAAGLELRFF